MRGVSSRLGSVLAVVAMVAAACTLPSPTGSYVPDDPVDTTIVPPFVNPSDDSLPLSEYQITVNIELTDTGFEPATIYIPEGRGIQLVLRNRGTTEHHYRVAGLVPTHLTWLATAEYNLSQLQDRPEDISEAEHLLHHLIAFVPFRDESPFGVQPLGTEVHGYAGPRDREIMRFIAVNTGTFPVEDVLHPEITGRVVVFAP